MDKHDDMNANTRRSILDNVQPGPGRNGRAKLGYVLIPNEQTIEEDMIRKALYAKGARNITLGSPQVSELNDTVAACLEKAQISTWLQRGKWA